MTTRRKFLKDSALTLGAMASMSQLSALPTHFGQQNVRAAVIGTGSRGQGLISLMNDIPGFEVVACCDVLPFRLEEGLAKVNGKAKGYAQYEELLNHPDLDAVVIATPFGLHDEVILATIQAGKHIYCEKTLAKGLSEIQAVVTAAEDSGKVFQTGHQYHSSPLYIKTRQIIQSGYLGEITGFRCQWNRNGDWRRPVPDPKWERMINWRMYRENSGGLVAELMSHQIDWINWVLEEYPERIVGMGGIDHWKDGRETFDNAHVLFEYPSGIDASFTATTTNGYEDYQIKVMGENGTIFLDYTHAEIYLESKVAKAKGLVDGVSGATQQAWAKGEGAPIDAPGNDPTINALMDFYDSIAHDIPPRSTLMTGAQTAKCVHICLDSLHNGGMRHWKDYPEIASS